MSTVVMHNVVSVDGYIADDNATSDRCSTGTPTVTPN
jgi:hypothetical protein